MYNCKIKNFGNGQMQVRTYSHLVYTGKRKKGEQEEIPMVEEPFSGTLVPAEGWEDKFYGKKEQSVRNSCSRALSNIYDIARSNEWEYFVTLTFNPEKVDSFDYGVVTKKLSKWLNHIKERTSKDLRYILVPELHKSGRYHFHGLFACCDGLKIVDGGHRDKKGNVIYNFDSYTLGFSTATVVQENKAVTKYITKYTTKELIENNKFKKKYWASKNLNRPIEETDILYPEEKEKFEQECLLNCKHSKQVEFELSHGDKRHINYFELEV